MNSRASTNQNWRGIPGKIAQIFIEYNGSLRGFKFISHILRKRLEGPQLQFDCRMEENSSEDLYLKNIQPHAIK